MALTHREENRSGQTIDWLENSEANLRVGVSRLGAELISIQCRNAKRDWAGFLHRDNDIDPPQRGWANHATVMGYFLHRLKNEHSLYRGHEIRGGTHSFLRGKTWKVAAQLGGEITYRIDPSDFSPAEYPLNVSLELTYSVKAAQLGAAFRFVNAEPQLSAHVGFGLHPGLAAKSFDSFQFKMPPGRYRRYLTRENFLSGEVEEIEFRGGSMPFERSGLPGSYILELLQTESRQFLFEDRGSGRGATIDPGNAPYLTLWSDGGAFLCVEPCWGLTDSLEQRAFEDKLGIQIIAPRSELAAHCGIVPRLL